MFVKDPVDEIIIYDFRNAVYPCCVTLTSKWTKQTSVIETLALY